MNETTLSNKTVTALGQLLQAHRKELREDLDKMAQSISRGSGGGGISHGYGVRNTGSDLKAQRTEVEKMIQAFKRNNKALSAYEQYMLTAARKHRQTLNDQIDAMDKAAKAQKKNTDAIDENSDAHEEQSQAIKDASDNTKRFVKGLAEGTLYLKGLKEAVSEFQTSYRLGFKWDPIKDALNGALMGMDPKAMMEFQAQFRRTSGAMAEGIDGFNKVVSANQMEMIQYTGSMQAAAQAMGNMYELSHNMGLRLEDVAGGADSLFQQFKKMQSVTSITVDQFVEMNQRMLSNSDIQSKLLRLNQQQRAQYIQGLNQQQLSLQMLGLQKEVAEQLISATEQMSGKKGLDRLQDSYKTQIMLQSVLGWDSASAQRVGYLKNKSVKTADESEELQRMMLLISEQVEQRKASGLDLGVTTQNEIFIDQLTEALGQSDFVDAGKQAALQQSAATNGAALAKQQVELQDRQTDYLQNIAKYTSAMSDMLGAWSQTAAAVLAGALVATLLNRTKLVEGMVGGIFERMGRNPGPGTPPGGSPTRGGRARDFLKGHWRGMAGGAGGAILGLGGSIAADQFLDPADFQPENRRDASAAHGALQWGSAGAGVGMLFGPVGAAIGGIVGAIGGAAYNVYQYSNDYAAQMEAAYSIGSKMLTGEQIRLRVEKQAKEEQIKNLEKQRDLTDEQKQSLIAMRRELDGINANLSVSDIKSQMMGSSTAAEYIQQMLSNGASFSDTGGLNDKAASLQTMIGLAGIKGNVKDALLANIGQAASAGGMAGEDWVGLSTIERALADGSDENIPAAWRQYVDKGFAATAEGLQQQIGTNVASIRDQAGADGTLSATVASQQADTAAAAEKVRKLEEELETMKQTIVPDPYGMGGLPLASKEQELNRAREALLAQQNAANVLQRAASGEAPIGVKFAMEDMEAFGKSVVTNMKKMNSNIPSPVAPHGFLMMK